MNWLTIKRILRTGLLDAWRNAFVSFSSILIMVQTLFVLGLVIFSGVVLNTTLNQLRDKADVNVYFVVGASEDQILTLQKSLQALPEVANAEYLSADDVLANFRQTHQDNQSVLQGLNDLGFNPFGAVINIKAKDISQYDAIAQFLQNQETISTGQPSIIDKINYFDPAHRAVLTRLQDITAAAGKLGAILIGIFVITTLLTLLNMIRLTIFMSRDEIQVMRLVGAGSFFIRAPFMVGGMLQGLIAGVITLLLLYPFTWWIGNTTADYFGGLNIFNYFLGHFPLFFLIMVGTGVVVGALSNFLAVRQYLKI